MERSDAVNSTARTAEPRAWSGSTRSGGIPAHSCLLMRDPGSRRSTIPTGDLAAGLVPGAAASPATSLFDVGDERVLDAVRGDADLLADLQRLPERAGRAPGRRSAASAARTSLEIGCGKGEFLLELCERGGNRGRRHRSRASCPGAGRVERRRAASASSTSSTPPSATATFRPTSSCAGTRSSTSTPTREFMQTVRRRDRRRPRHAACSSRCPTRSVSTTSGRSGTSTTSTAPTSPQGALERLFLDCGFEVLDSWKGFGDQYLLIEARPLPPEQRARPAGCEEDLGGARRRRCRSFARGVPRGAAQAWRERFRAWSADGRRVVIWGAGSKGVAFLTTLGVRDAAGVRRRHQPAQARLLHAGHRPRGRLAGVPAGVAARRGRRHERDLQRRDRPAAGRHGAAAAAGGRVSSAGGPDGAPCLRRCRPRSRPRGQVAGEMPASIALFLRGACGSRPAVRRYGACTRRSSIFRSFPSR